jgi:hypothetical protein
MGGPLAGRIKFNRKILVFVDWLIAIAFLRVLCHTSQYNSTSTKSEKERDQVPSPQGKSEEKEEDEREREAHQP